MTLLLLVEQFGLADPERFVWTLHDRLVPTGCPLTTEYLVTTRNFDSLTTPGTQTQYSAYIHDIILTYFSQEFCTGPDPLAYTVPFSTDPEAAAFTSVAANNFDGNGLFFDNNLLPHNASGGLEVGYFYSGLTRDDVAGLKYLFTTNNVNLEFPNPDALLYSIVTNFNLPQQLLPATLATTTANGGFYTYDGTIGYGDYGWLVATSLTNSPAVLQALYPGLVIATSTNYFVLWQPISRTLQYFTNSGVGQPFPPPLILVTKTNRTPFLQERFVTTFANAVFPHKIRPTTVSKLQTISVVPNYGAPYPAPPVTNSTTQTITQNIPSGDFFVVPLFHTNLCPIDILYTGLTNVVSITNFLTGAGTNIVTSSNTVVYTSTMVQINNFTNYTFVIQPVTCAEVPNAPNLYQGIGGTKFVREDYDSLFGQFFQPVTNYFTMVVLTNSMWVSQPVCSGGDAAGYSHESRG